jgi:hypothetical protein
MLKGRFIVQDGKVVALGSTQSATANTPPPTRTQSPTGKHPDSLGASDIKLDSPIELAIYQTLSTYRDYFLQGFRATLAKDIAKKVRSLGELSSEESITAVVRRSIDWSGHAVPQPEITTITIAVTTAIQSALRRL